MDSFLESLNLPKVKEEQNKALTLTAEITVEEMKRVISKLKTNKSPTPQSGANHSENH